MTKARLALVALVGVAALCVPGTVLGAVVNPTLAGTASDSATLSGMTSTAIGTFLNPNYAYASNYYRGTLSVIDISNPAQPVPVGESASANSLLNGTTMNIAGGYAYVVSKNRNGPSGSNSNDNGTGNGFTILDISTFPTQPVIVGSITDPINLFGAYGVAVSGSYAYVAAQGCLSGQPCPNKNVGDSFVVIDISSPSNPTIVATIKNSSLPASWAGTNALKHPTAVAISGNYAYVTASYSGRFTVIDISDPLHPTIVSSLLDAKLGFDVDVAVDNGYAYVAEQQSAGRLAVVDVHDPQHPQVVGLVANTLLNGAYRVRVRGNFAYIPASIAAALAAVDISDPAAPRYVGSVQSSTAMNKTIGVDVGASGRFAYATSGYQSTQPQPLYPPYPPPSGPGAPTGTFSSVDFAPAPISVAITSTSKPANPTTLTSASLKFSINLAVSTPRCRLDGGPYGLCTTPTSQDYSGLSPGAHTFDVKALDSAGNSATDSYTWTVVPVVPTQAPLAPVLDTFDRADGPVGANWTLIRPTGFAAMNVSANTAVDASTSGLAWNYWNPATFGPDVEAYVSLARLGASDTIRIGARVVPGTSHAGYYVNVTSGGTWSILRYTNSTSTPVTLATIVRPVATDDAIGIRVVGSVITALQRTNADGWVQILTYDTSSDSVRYTNAGRIAVEFKTSAIDNFGGGAYVQTSPPANTTAPSISGSAVEGQVLTASPGVWTGAPPPAFTYQWERCDDNGAACGAIAGATESIYTLSANDVGSTVRVVVTGSNAAGTANAVSPVTAVVTAVPAIAPTNNTPPAVSGNAQQGQTLAAVPGSWSGSPTPVVVLQWQRCDQSGSSCVDVAGATGATYDVGSTDVGATIRVVETASNASGSSSAVSAPTAVVVAISPPVNITAPVVSGTAQEGQPLSATGGSWSGTPTPTVALQWQRCDQNGAGCLDIVPATASTYTAVASDVGSTLRVVATATNTVGSASAPSAVTGVVSSGATPPVNTSLPTIAGVPQQAQTLTASPGGWSGLPAPTFAYQWQRCNSAGSNCGDLPGATASTYTLGLADVGTTLRVVVTASNSSGTAAATSAVTAAVSAPPLGMPATPLLDDFNRPDNAGPPSASWSPLAIVNNPVGNNLRIVGQQVAAMTGATGDFWNAQQFGPDSEVWVTVTVKPTVDTDMVSLALRLSNPTLSTGQGYQAYFYNRSGLDEYRLYKRVAGSAVQLAFVAGPELQVGDRLLFRAVGTNLELWQGRGGSWTKLLSATDSTYTGAGYLGLSGKNTVVRLDNFGGGTLP